MSSRDPPMAAIEKMIFPSFSIGCGSRLGVRGTEKHMSNADIYRSVVCLALGIYPNYSPCLSVDASAKAGQAEIREFANRLDYKTNTAMNTLKVCEGYSFFIFR
jgi:hypothetical protein